MALSKDEEPDMDLMADGLVTAGDEVVRSNRVCV